MHYVSYFVNEARSDGYDRQCQRVYRVDNVVDFDWIQPSGKSFKVFIFDGCNEIEREVEERVKSVAQYIERQIVKVKAYDRFSTDVEPDLRVVRDRPGCEVNPT